MFFCVCGFRVFIQFKNISAIIDYLKYFHFFFGVIYLCFLLSRGTYGLPYSLMALPILPFVSFVSVD